MNRKVLSVGQTIQEKKANTLTRAIASNWDDCILIAAHRDTGVIVNYASGEWPAMLADWFVQNPKMMRGFLIAAGKASTIVQFNQAGPGTVEIDADRAELTPEDLEPPTSPIEGPNGQLLGPDGNTLEIESEGGDQSEIPPTEEGDAPSTDTDD